MPLGDMSIFGAGWNGITSIATYWSASSIGGTDPTIGLYSQVAPGQNPPIPSALSIGTDVEAANLDGTEYWWLMAMESASFIANQWYELSFKALSAKTTSPNSSTLLAPKLSIYMTGDAFTDGGDDLGKFIGLIEDTSPVKKKWVDIDAKDKDKEKGIRFAFKADGTETGLPKFKIDAGVWTFWDISIKPLENKGYTPGSWDVIFPTLRGNVGVYDSLDFRFEFYNNAGEIANYTAIVNAVP